MKPKGLTATHLKLIAICAMFLDHMVGTSPISHDTVWGMLLRVPGRITAPIMCYLIAEGFYHTSNKKKYLHRLLLFALIAHIPYNLCMSTRFPTTSVMWTLAMGLWALMVVKRKDLPLWAKAAATLLCCGLAYFANWNFVGVLWIVFFGLYHGDFKKQMVSFALIGLLLHVVPTFTYLDYGFGHEEMSHWYQLFIFLAVPLLILYSGERGNGPKWLGKFFYWFYPAHLLLIFGINRLF